MNPLKTSLILFTVLCCLLAAAPVMALSSDREQPIHIEADRLDVDDASGVATYRGNVRYRQGSIVLDADVLQIHTARDRSLQKVHATGQPAAFQQQLDKNDTVVKGQARVIEYRATDEYILFRDDAHFWQAGDEFAGSQIEYFMTDELVKARKSEAGDERVQVILQPRPAADGAGADSEDTQPESGNSAP
jgi:lipopolysaccharide export system protein LptA